MLLKAVQVNLIKITKDKGDNEKFGFHYHSVL